MELCLDKLPKALKMILLIADSHLAPPVMQARLHKITIITMIMIE